MALEKLSGVVKNLDEEAHLEKPTLSLLALINRAASDASYHVKILDILRAGKPLWNVADLRAGSETEFCSEEVEAIHVLTHFIQSLSSTCALALVQEVEEATRRREQAENLLVALVEELLEALEEVDVGGLHLGEFLELREAIVQDSREVVSRLDLGLLFLLLELGDQAVLREGPGESPLFDAVLEATLGADERRLQVSAVQLQVQLVARLAELLRALAVRAGELLQPPEELALPVVLQ